MKKTTKKDKAPSADKRALMIAAANMSAAMKILRTALDEALRHLNGGATP